MPKEFENTWIHVSVPTDYQHRNEIEEARTQIEQLSFQLSSLFFFIQKTNRLYDHLDMGPEHVERNFTDLRAELESVCAVGMGLAGAVNHYSEKLTWAAEAARKRLTELEKAGGGK